MEWSRQNGGRKTPQQYRQNFAIWQEIEIRCSQRERPVQKPSLDRWRISHLTDTSSRRLPLYLYDWNLRKILGTLCLVLVLGSACKIGSEIEIFDWSLHVLISHPWDPTVQMLFCFHVWGDFLFISFFYLSFPYFFPPSLLKVLFKTYPIAPSSQPRSRGKISSSLSVGVMRVDGSGEAVARRWRGGGGGCSVCNEAVNINCNAQTQWSYKIPPI